MPGGARGVRARRAREAVKVYCAYRRYHMHISLDEDVADVSPIVVHFSALYFLITNVGRSQALTTAQRPYLLYGYADNKLLIETGTISSSSSSPWWSTCESEDDRVVLSIECSGDDSLGVRCGPPPPSPSPPPPWPLPRQGEAHVVRLNQREGAA